MTIESPELTSNRGLLQWVQEVAELVAFLASSRATFLTGGTYTADGGMLAALGVTTRGRT